MNTCNRDHEREDGRELKLQRVGLELEVNFDELEVEALGRDELAQKLQRTSAIAPCATHHQAHTSHA